jgi:hypothetical protein
MRTVTFAAAPVKRLLSDSFVCAVINTTGDPAAGASLSHTLKDPAGPCLRGNGEHNVQIVVLTPAGELFHVLSGFIGPEELERELTFALSTYKAIKQDPENAGRTVRNRHVEFLKKQGSKEDELDGKSTRGFPNFMGFDPQADGGPNFGNGQFSMDKMFDGFTKQRVLADHRFAMEHPMMPIEQFRTEMLVGSGKSFFGSTSSGGAVSGGSGRARQSGKRSRP